MTDAAAQADPRPSFFGRLDAGLNGRLLPSGSGPADQRV